MWSPPDKTKTYIMGGDPTQGITGWSRGTRTDGDHKVDNAALEIFEVDGVREGLFTLNSRGERVPDFDPVTKQRRYLYRDVQVAEFAAPCDAVEFARVANVLGRIYAGDQEDQCQFIYEAWPGPGMLTTQELLRLGYANLWMWEYIDSVAEETTRIGWRSTRESQKLLWYRARRHLMNRSALVRSKFLLDEYANAEIDLDKMRARACFLPNTPVMHFQGRTAIKDIQIGSTIVTRLGQPGVVLNKIENHFAGDLVSLRLTGFNETQYATPSHWIWTMNSIHSRNSEWRKAGDLRNGNCVFIPRRQQLPLTKFTQDQLWLMGLWLAEGNFVRYNGIRCGIRISSNDNTQLKRAWRILREWFPTNEGPPRYDGYVHKGPSKGSIQFRRPRGRSKKAGGYLDFGNYQASALFAHLLGEYSDSKQLAPELANSFGILPLIAGHFDGDGTQRGNQQRDCALYTDSYQLAYQFRRSLLDHGIWCSLQSVKRKGAETQSFVINIKANEVQPLTDFSTRMEKVTIKACKRIVKLDVGYWVPVKIARLPYNGPVFDLSIQDEHSYCVEFAVHNSYGYHDDRFMAANLCFWAGHAWTYEVERTAEPVTTVLVPDYQQIAPTLDEHSSYAEWRANATADWD